ncbi:MAG: hypothetical protein ABF296_10850 [Oceanococcaceae bacterium]
MRHIPPRIRALLCCAAFGLGCVPGIAMPADIDSVVVDHRKNRYTVEMHARMDADAARAYAVFTNYERLVDINDAIITSQRIAGGLDGAQRIHTQVRVCVMGICRIFDQVQDMQPTPPEHLEARVIPNMSNLKYGLANWRIWNEDGRAHLYFRAEVEPDFWVPPVVGPWLIKRKLESEAQQTANGIERLANQQPAPAAGTPVAAQLTGDPTPPPLR